MANLNAPYGLRPVNANGRPWEGALSRYHVDAGDGTALYKGDPVKLTTTAPTDTRHGIVSDVIRAAAGDPIVGVFMGLAQPSLTAGGLMYRAALTAAYCLVCDDPDVYFLAQEDSVTAAMAATDCGKNINLVAGTGSAVTGLSGFMLDSNTADTANTLDFQVIRLAPMPNNIIGNYAQWIVKPNTHQRAHDVTGVGD
jgi:hypothetical protein